MAQVTQKPNTLAGKSSLDIIGLLSGTLTTTFRLLNYLVHTRTPLNQAKVIMLVWKRSGVFVESLERGEEYKEKMYPQLTGQIKQKHNTLYKYRIPAGLSWEKIKTSIPNIEFATRGEVLLRTLETDGRAHFSLKILSGKLLDLITFSNESAELPEIRDKVQKISSGLWIPLGWSRRGLEQLDLSNSNSPHLMIGGTTGGGKSILGRLIMVVLHLRYTRSEVRIWACDLKHGNGISMLGETPLLVDRVVTEASDVYDMLMDASVEIGRRYALCRKHQCDDVTAYNKEYSQNRIPRIVIYIDELTKLEGKEFEECRDLMTRVVGEARGAGVHFIISCHRPDSKLISGTLKMNIPAVVAFRCNATSARVLLGEAKENYQSAAAIDADVEGRALFQFKDQVLIQIPYIDNTLVRILMKDYQMPPVSVSACGTPVLEAPEPVVMLSTRAKS